MLRSHRAIVIERTWHTVAMVWILASLLQAETLDDKGSIYPLPLFPFLKTYPRMALSASPSSYGPLLFPFVCSFFQFGKCQYQAGLPSAHQTVGRSDMQYVCLTCILWDISGATTYYSISVFLVPN